MTVTATPAYAQALKNTCVTIANADAQTFKTAYTGGTNGSIVIALLATSTDTTARDVTLNLTISATNFQIGQISIPITAGTLNSAPTINLLNNSQVSGLPRDQNGNPFLYIASGTTLTVNAPVTVTTAKILTITAIAEDL